MKLFFFFLLAFPCFAMTPPGQEVVDKYVDLALRIDVEKAQNVKGNWLCRDAFQHQHQGRGRTQEEAITVHQLLCIKHQCNTLGAKVHETGLKLKGMSEEDLRDFLEFNGYSKEEIELRISRLKTASPEQAEIENCQTGTPAFRMAAFDACFSVPVECYKD